LFSSSSLSPFTPYFIIIFHPVKLKILLFILKLFITLTNFYF